MLYHSQKDVDDEKINDSDEFSVCKDRNKLYGMAGRDYMVKMMCSYELLEIFCALKDAQKPVELE